MIELTVKNIDENRRLDVFLSEKISEFSRAKIQEFIKAGFVLVNNKKGKASYIVQSDDNIKIEIPEKK